MKKRLTMLLVLALVLGMLAGCGRQETPGPAQDGTETKGNPEEITLTIGLPMNALVEDYDTNAFTEWLEEQTGYNLEFITFPAGQADYKSKLSTMMMTSSDKLPDILWNFNIGDPVYTEYGEDGLFLDISERLYDREKSANFWNSFEKLDETFQKNILRRITSDDGAIYVFPRIEETEIDIIDSMAMINQSWLDKLGLKMPTDPDSLYEVLKAFKTQDPNGNGKADEIPLIGGAGMGGRDVTDWIINMFIYHDSQKVFNLDAKGQLYAPVTTDAYREALIYMHKLVSEGLMTEACWTLSYTDMRAMLNPLEGVDQTVGLFLGHPTLTLEQGHSGITDWAAVPHWGYTIINENANTRTCFITEDCENVDAAWNLLMTMCSEEGARRMRYGEEGVDWVYADPGSKSFLGYDAEIKLLTDAFGQKGNECWKVVDATILLNAENETNQLSDDMDDWTKAKMALMRDVHDFAWDAYAADGHEAHARPQIVLSSEESEATENIRINCGNWIDSCLASFVCGTGSYNDPSNDTQWKNYLAELERLGLPDWIQQYQRIMEENAQ